MADGETASRPGIGPVAEDAIAGIAAAVALVPVVGGSFATILTGYATHESRKRLEALIADVYVEVHKIGDDKVDQHYLHSQEFLDLLVRASRVAFDTRDAEKRRWCAAILAGALTVERSDDLDHEALLKVVGSLSPQTLVVARESYLTAIEAAPVNYTNPPMVDVPPGDYGGFHLARLVGVGLVSEDPPGTYGSAYVRYRVAPIFRELMAIVGVAASEH